MTGRRLRIKRVYEAVGPDDGARVLVDRLWPRGVSREGAQIALWLKDIAPSDALRKRFHGKPEDWALFCDAYAEELAEPAARSAVERGRSCLRDGAVTLLYAARDTERNNAVALKTWLERLFDNPI
jgi:uncharacterized protein YeaO (DUF488 family)